MPVTVFRNKGKYKWCICLRRNKTNRLQQYLKTALKFLLRSSLYSSGSSVSVGTRLRYGRPVFDSRRRRRIFHPSSAPGRLWGPPSPCAMGTGGYFPARWCWPLIPFSCRNWEREELYLLCSPNALWLIAWLLWWVVYIRRPTSKTSRGQFIISFIFLFVKGLNFNSVLANESFVE
jgi:hypothetical protein